MIKLRLALCPGLAVAFPFWAFQILRFVSPGLPDREKRGLFPLLVSSVLLFAAATAAHRVLRFFAFAEIIMPPVSEPIVAPLAVMVPLVILYETSIVVAQRIEVRRLSPVAKAIRALLQRQPQPFQQGRQPDKSRTLCSASSPPWGI
jgi:Sec-independent protein secretion pathway component TatC